MTIPKDIQERAARALCRQLGLPEDTMFDGKPAWAWYTDHATTMLKAAFPDGEWKGRQNPEANMRD